MTDAETHRAVVIPSALTRADYLQLTRALRRRSAQAPWWLVASVMVLLSGLLLLIGSRYTGRWVVAPQVISGWLAACAVIYVAAALRQPYRMWAGQQHRLTAAGTVTFDVGGVRRDVPGVVEARVPWSRIEAVVDTGRVMGLQIGRYEWIMFALPGDAAVAAQVREVLRRHCPEF